MLENGYKKISSTTTNSFLIKINTVNAHYMRTYTLLSTELWNTMKRLRVMGISRQCYKSHRDNTKSVIWNLTWCRICPAWLGRARGRGAAASSQPARSPSSRPRCLSPAQSQLRRHACLSLVYEQWRVSMLYGSRFRIYSFTLHNSRYGFKYF